MKTIATASLPAAVSLPAYDRDALKSRIVHLGFGAFHRAHQALLTNRVLNLQGGDWGICEISLFGNESLINVAASAKSPVHRAGKRCRGKSGHRCRFRT